MVSNVSSTGGTEGGRRFRPVEGKRARATPNPEPRRDERLPQSARPLPPALIRTTALPRNTAGHAQASSNADGVIDPHYIEQVREKAMAAYPSDGKYSPSPYNALGLRLPFHLTGHRMLYDRQHLVRDEDRATAITSYVELAKQYESAYVDFLRAASGSEEALARLKVLLAQGKIFNAAGVQTAWLNIKKKPLLYEFQGHLCLDVLRSADAEIPAKARICALEIMRYHFDVAAVAKTLAGGTDGKTGRGLLVHEHEQVFDLIPEIFLVDEEEGTKSHASLFLQNKYVKSIFTGSKDNSRPFDRSALELASKYPEETIQTLLGMLRVSEATPSERKSAFLALVTLTTLDESRKERIFGADASYRNGGRSPIRSLPRADGNFDANDPRGYFRTLCLHPDTPNDLVGELAKAACSVLVRKCRDDASASGAQRAAEIIEAYQVLSNRATLQQYRSIAQQKVE